MWVVPAGVFNLVNGLGSQAGSAICGHPDISLISFTGGTATGRVVAATAAPMVGGSAWSGGAVG